MEKNKRLAMARQAPKPEIWKIELSTARGAPYLSPDAPGHPAAMIAYWISELPAHFRGMTVLSEKVTPEKVVLLLSLPNLPGVLSPRKVAEWFAEKTVAQYLCGAVSGLYTPIPRSLWAKRIRWERVEQPLETVF